jgi:hypothetical protein
MPSTSEKTFGQRLEHARTLQAALNKMVGYKPDNTALEAATFNTFLDSVEAANDVVAGNGQTLSDARTTRRLAYFGDAKNGVPGLATLAGRVRDAVGSMPGGKKSPSYKQIQKLTQKISNYRPPKKAVTPSPGSTGPEKKKVSQSEASYGSLVQAGRDLAAAAGKVAGYNPGAADLKPNALKSAMDTLADTNKTVAEALVDTEKAIAERSKIYEADETGLKSQFQQAKAAVASQFGRRSPEYKSVANIKY